MAIYFTEFRPQIRIGSVVPMRCDCRRRLLSKSGADFHIGNSNSPPRRLDRTSYGTTVLAWLSGGGCGAGAKDDAGAVGSEESTRTVAETQISGVNFAESHRGKSLSAVCKVDFNKLCWENVEISSVHKAGTAL